jgi:hypothetical protein
MLAFAFSKSFQLHRNLFPSLATSEEIAGNALAVLLTLHRSLNVAGSADFISKHILPSFDSTQPRVIARVLTLLNAFIIQAESARDVTVYGLKRHKPWRKNEIKIIVIVREETVEVACNSTNCRPQSFYGTAKTRLRTICQFPLRAS